MCWQGSKNWATSPTKRRAGRTPRHDRLRRGQRVPGFVPQRNRTMLTLAIHLPRADVVKETSGLPVHPGSPVQWARTDRRV